MMRRTRNLMYVFFAAIIVHCFLSIILNNSSKSPQKYCIELKPIPLFIGETYIYYSSFRHGGKKELTLYNTDCEMRETTDCSIYGDIIIKTSVKFSKRTYKRGEKVSVEIRIKAICDRTTAVTSRRNDGYPTHGGGGTYIADGVYLSIFFDCKVRDPL